MGYLKISRAHFFGNHGPVLRDLISSCFRHFFGRVPGSDHDQASPLRRQISHIEQLLLRHLSLQRALSQNGLEHAQVYARLLFAGTKHLAHQISLRKQASFERYILANFPQEDLQVHDLVTEMIM